MKIPLSLSAAVLSLSVFSTSALAADAVGRVRGVYIQETRGVLAEYKGARVDSDLKRWVDVELESSPGQRVLAAVPVGLPARAGDRVGVELASAQREGMAASQDTLPVAQVNRITPLNSSVLASASTR